MRTRQSKEIQEGITYIKDKIAECLSLSQGVSEAVDVKEHYIFDRGVYRFEVIRESVTIHELEFSEERVEDFGAARIREPRSDYGLRFKHYVDFKIYVELGKAGLTPQFSIARAFVDEKRGDWWGDKYAPVHAEGDFARVLYAGLKKAAEVLSRYVNEYTAKDEKATRLEEDRDRVQGMIGYHDSHQGSLSENRSSVKSIALLKAAAILEILAMEKSMREENRPSFTQAIAKKLYTVAEQLRTGPFLEVECPWWMKDYIVEEQSKSVSNK